jgi:DNA-binding GntR family transcriptional regulator
MDELTKIAVNPAPVRQQVVERIQAAIMSGRFKPGQRLVEKDLCETFGVSRPSIREALRQLESEGFIEASGSRGPAVTRLTVEDIRGLYEVRAVLEAQATKLFAERATNEEIAALTKAVDEIARSYRDGSVEERILSKTKFYEIIIAGSRNKTLSNIFRNTIARINLMRAMSLSSPARLPKSLKEIRAVLEALKQRDGQRAFQLSIRHVEAAADVVLRQIG